LFYNNVFCSVGLFMLQIERLNVLLEAFGGSALRPLLHEGEILFGRCADELLRCAQVTARADLRALAHLRRGQAAILGCDRLARALEALEVLAADVTQSHVMLLDQTAAIGPIARDAAAALCAYASQLPDFGSVNGPATNPPRTRQ
jgi:hypothetical protein